MITIKNKASIRKMAHAGAMLVEIFEYLAPHIVTGVSTLELNEIIEEQLKKRDLESRTKGYMGYRHASCISINDEVVHGVPAIAKKLQDGDLVKIDVCASWRGYCADMARSFYVGEMPLHVRQFVENAQNALNRGIKQARAGNRLGDISAAIQHEIERQGYGIVRDFAGHGIGKQMHEDPEILNVGTAGKGPLLRPGMVFAIEPMTTMGKDSVHVTDDGWTVKTNDKSLAAHVEDTVVITENEPIILTRSTAAHAA